MRLWRYYRREKISRDVNQARRGTEGRSPAASGLEADQESGREASVLPGGFRAGGRRDTFRCDERRDLTHCSEGEVDEALGLLPAGTIFLRYDEQ